MNFQLDVGEISVSSDGVHWIVPDICEMVKKTGYWNESSLFGFANEEWWMMLHPYRFSASSVEDYLGIGAISSNTDIRYRTFQFRIIGEPQGHFVQREAKYKVDTFFKCFTSIPFSYLNSLKYTMLPGGKLHVFLGIEDKKGESLQGSFMQFTTEDGKENHSGSCNSPAEISSLDEKLCSEKSAANDCVEAFSQTEEEADTDYAMKPNYSVPLKILGDFKELYLKQEGHDVIVNVKGKEFLAHKAILIARSPVFASTFKNDMKEKATGIINIEDCDPSSFPDFLCFLYSGQIQNISTENVFSLFITADKYNVQDLRLECLEFMKNNLSVNTFCDTVTLALQYCERELIELTSSFFGKHFQEIIVTVQWQSFLVKNPIQGNEILIKALVTKK